MGGVPLFLSSPGGIVGNITRWGRSYTLPSEEIRSRQPLLKGEEEKKREEIERIVRRLRAIDRKVRAHELAHMSVGGQYAGAPHYTYVRGPDGRLYAVAGEVPIDASPEKDPEATVKKMQQVIAAALAPADPSPQDYRVAAVASQQLMRALNELAKKKAKKLYGDFSHSGNHLERFLRGEETSHSPQRGERNDRKIPNGETVETIFTRRGEDGNTHLGEGTISSLKDERSPSPNRGEQIVINRVRKEKINSP